MVKSYIYDFYAARVVIAVSPGAASEMGVWDSSPLKKRKGGSSVKSCPPAAPGEGTGRSLPGLDYGR